MKMGITALQLETVEAAGSGDMATEVGRYALQGPGGQVIDEGKYIVIWKQEAGQLKVHRDIWNSNRPASG
jgi:ketosteroid isomerase-like protein